MDPPGPRPSSPFWTAALTRPPFPFGLRVGRAQRRKGGWRRRICTVFQPRMSVTSWDPSSWTRSTAIVIFSRARSALQRGRATWRGPSGPRLMTRCPGACGARVTGDRAGRRRAGGDGSDGRCPFARIGATAPNGVVVAKGADDLPPHNALRSCHITPEVNGCAVPLHGPQAATRSGDCRGPRYGPDRGRCAWGARQSQGMLQ